jgi:hypothetical protein
MCHRPARVAQLDRASASEAEGCGFDSRHAHHSTTLNTVGGVLQNGIALIRLD